MKPKRQILLVDDEPNVVEGLQRFLRMYRGRWDVATATSARAALDLMDARAFDVIVSDMRMPEMDGASFLAVAKAKFPSTMRVVLSGQTDAEAAMRAVPVAHQFLSKPTDPTELYTLIERLACTHDAIANPAVRAAIGGLDALPSTSSSYQQLSELVADEEAAPQDIATLVEAEPAIALKLLQLVNSAFFGVRRPIVTIAEAVGYLGTETVRALVLAESVVQRLPVRAALFDMGHFHAHSFAVAQMARYIDPSGERAGLSLVAALLHDIGRLVIASALPEVYDAISARAAHSGRDFETEEAESLGCTTVQVGAALLEMWGLAFPVVETLVSFHDAPRAGSTSLGAADVVYLAHRLVAKEGFELESDEDRAYLARLGVESMVADWSARGAELRG